MNPPNELSVDSGATNDQTSRSRAIRQLNESRNHGIDACIRADSHLAFDIEHLVGFDSFLRVCNDYFWIGNVFKLRGLRCMRCPLGQAL